MRVLIFGATGMLGHKLYQRLQPKFDVFATIRSDFASITRFGVFNEPSIIDRIDITNPASIRKAIDIVRPDCVINSIGIIKQVPASKEIIKTLTINSVFPHRLAELSAENRFRLITISTDCVFDGKRGNYSENDAPNAADLYGRSKLLGEVSNDNTLTIRTSLIGRELSTSNSIVEWFLGNRGRSVEGFTKAIYSGFPTIVLADIVAMLLDLHPDLSGIYHISSDPISKYQLLELLNQHFQAGVTVQPRDDVVIDRSLDSSRFRSAVNFQPAEWTDMIRQMADDPTPYDRWRK